MKGRASKENNPISGNQFVASTYRVEADQKEIIIRNLKGDLDSLKKNEGEYRRFNDHYRQLQHRFKLLSDENGNDDREFKMRHDAAVRSISQLNNQIDALRAELRDKKLEINDLDSDFTELKTQLDERTIELQNLKNDYKGSIADSEELATERESLSNMGNKLGQIIGQAHEQEKLLKEDNDSVMQRLHELQQYQEQLLLQAKMLREKIQGYENENNELDGSISDICDHMNDLELSIKKAQGQFTDLQRAIAEINLLNEKYKSEVQHVQKSIQAEILKNNGMGKHLKNAEYTQKVRVGQAEECEVEIAGLKQEKEGLNNINSKLAEDLQSCRIHLDNLGLLNLKLVEHLENFAEEDETVRELIHRNQRVQYCRGRVGQAQQDYKSTTLGSKFNEETQGTTARRQYRL